MAMDITAALTADEIALCSHAERACGETSALLDRVRCGGGEPFGESLRVKVTMDGLEEEAMSSPSWDILAVLVNCEFRLYLINQRTPLRNNPFLSHWVETIQRLEQQLSTASTIENAAHAGDAGIKINEIWEVRLGLIKALLQSRNVTQFVTKSPKQLYTDFVQLQQRDPFDLRPYIRMLEEEDIYERTPEPPEPHTPSQAAPPTPPKTSNAPTPRSSKPNDFQQWKQTLVARLQHEPELAIPELTHLPIELPSLDFLTTLLQEKTLQAHNIDPAPIISDYIQHALRLTEQMGESPSASSAPAASAAPHPDVAEEDAALVVTETQLQPGDHGREAQTRAVKLLLLFLRNLIRKALVAIDAIYFEIQEICVRYVWMREVREFRAFIEEGEGLLGREGGRVD